MTTDATPQQQQAPQQSQSQPRPQNVRAVAKLEREFSRGRSLNDRLGSAIFAFTGRISMVVIHAIWFLAWFAINTGKIANVAVFDPYPFTFLTLIVSLEAIFLTFFVLMGQNAQTVETDRWAHLDLQINLLAEEEMTEALRMLRELCRDRGVATSSVGRVDELLIRTDVPALARAIEASRGTALSQSAIYQEKPRKGPQ